ncbi:MAG: hypothetical protein KGY69_06640 [Bacteroidales bacterium]|nr:hypothetical protein [Bacteroidales bacterium]
MSSVAKGTAVETQCLRLGVRERQPAGTKAQKHDGTTAQKNDGTKEREDGNTGSE